MTGVEKLREYLQVRKAMLSAAPSSPAAKEDKR